MHWYQDWYQVGFCPLRFREANPLQIQLVAGVEVGGGCWYQTSLGRAAPPQFAQLSTESQKLIVSSSPLWRSILDHELSCVHT